ncbi:MAG: hypothetical protein ACKOVH_08545, partial [Actinomycetota bacterium]
MTREPEVALVLSAEEWVDEFHRYCVDHGGARVRSLVLDPAVALDEDFDVLIAGARWPALTRPFVDALHRRDQRVLVVGDAGAGPGPAHGLGVDGIVGPATTPAELVDAVRALVPAPERSGGRRGSAPAPVVPTTGSVAPAVVAVGGPRGAGSTEVALALAGWFTAGGARAVLVDADLEAPAVAVRLGLPVEPNLCTAVDAAASGPDTVPGALFDLGDDWPVVLVGAPRREAAMVLTAAELGAVLGALAARYAPVLVDVSSGPDGVGAPASAALTRAGAVVAVGAATPVGVVRLVEWIDAVRALAPGATVHVVVNRAPAGRARRAEIVGALQRGGGVARCTFVPADPRVDDAAWAAGLVGRGPFARATEQLGATLRDRLVPGGPG